MRKNVNQSPAEKLVLYVGAGIVLLMIMHISTDIVTRNFFNSPIEGTYEITVHWYMVAITAIGLWAAAMKNDHIVVTLVSDRLAPYAALIWRVVANIITVGVLLVLSWYGFDTAMDRMASGEFTGAAEIPIWQTRFFLPLGFLAFAGVMTIGTIRDVADTRASQEVIRGAEVAND